MSMRKMWVRKNRFSILFLDLFHFHENDDNFNEKKRNIERKKNTIEIMKSVIILQLLDLLNLTG